MTFVTNLVGLISGWKTYIAGAGLVGLSVYKFSVGDYQGGWQAGMQALTAIGIRHAIAKSEF